MKYLTNHTAMKRAFLAIALMIAAGFLATGAWAQDTDYNRGDDSHDPRWFYFACDPALPVHRS